MPKERLNQTFGIDSCHDMYSKLDRELKRLNDADHRGDIEDHAINFAITAWHMIDWVWAAYEDQRLLFKREAKIASANWETSKGLGKFRQYILEREPRLRNCGLIANSAKHLVLDYARWPEQSKVETRVSAAASYTPSGLPKWTPKIVVGDKRLNARDEFDCILHFWGTFIHGECEEDSLRIVEARGG